VIDDIDNEVAEVLLETAKNIRVLRGSEYHHPEDGIFEFLGYEGHTYRFHSTELGWWLTRVS
jgi:hypothetical protein